MEVFGSWSDQLSRLKNQNIKVIVSIDEIALSGGYLIAAMSNKIICGSLASVGSIGVVSGQIYLGEMLDKLGIKYLKTQYGQNKNHSSMFEHMPVEQQPINRILHDAHRHFIDIVKKNRHNLDIKSIKKGEQYDGPQNSDHKLRYKLSEKKRSKKWQMYARNTAQISKVE